MPKKFENPGISRRSLCIQTIFEMQSLDHLRLPRYIIIITASAAIRGTNGASFGAVAPGVMSEVWTGVEPEPGYCSSRIWGLAMVNSIGFWSPFLLKETRI